MPHMQIQYDSSAIVQKHYTLGRLATELALVMPDKRTVYITDDGTNVRTDLQGNH